MPDERKTVGMLRGSKEELFAQGHPVIRQLREIPGLIFPEEIEGIPSSAISLKELFTRKQMDENHVDCLILYQIAAGVLHILMALSEKNIYPGLIALGDFYAELLPGGVQVYLTHPEKFQLLHYEQDYEWYPEDERLFGDLELFDGEAQKKADLRLLYKILVASAKGNVKMPPKFTEADYSELFYKALPDEWKQLFQSDGSCDYETVDRMLAEHIQEEEDFARQTKEKLDEKAKKRLDEQRQDIAQQGKDSKGLYTMIVLLRTEVEEARLMSRMLYRLQDELETEAELSHLHWEQAFVFGNGNIAVREFQAYAPGFRCQCEQEIKEYSAGEALLIAANLMGETMKLRGGQQEDMFRMYVLADGRLKNDRIFRAAIAMLSVRQKEGMEFFLETGEDSRCEACQKLGNLMKQQEERYADPGNPYI